MLHEYRYCTDKGAVIMKRACDCRLSAVLLLPSLVFSMPPKPDQLLSPVHVGDDAVKTISAITNDTVSMQVCC